MPADMRKPGSPETQSLTERAEWRAQTDAGTAIPTGAEVEVISVRGTRLVVAPMNE